MCKTHKFSDAGVPLVKTMLINQKEDIARNFLIYLKAQMSRSYSCKLVKLFCRTFNFLHLFLNRDYNLVLLPLEENDIIITILNAQAKIKQPEKDTLPQLLTMEFKFTHLSLQQKINVYYLNIIIVDFQFIQLIELYLSFFV